MEENKQYRGFLFDLDGTLAKSKLPASSLMVSLVCRLLNHGSVGIVTGGKFMQVKKQFIDRMRKSLFRNNFFVFCCSGGFCRKLSGGEWRTPYRHKFLKGEAERISKVISFSLEKSGILIKKHFGPQIELRESQITWSGLGQNAPLKEKCGWDIGGGKRLRIVEYLWKHLPEYEIRINATSSIDITPYGINKAYAVRQFMDMESLNPYDVVFVGDGLFHGGNDEIVKETFIETYPVKTPKDTESFIRSYIARN